MAELRTPKAPDAPDSDDLKRWVRVLATAGLALAVLALVGHHVGVPLLTSVQVDLRAMSTLTATGVILLSIGILAEAADRRSVVGRLAVSAALALALVVLASYVTQGKDAITPWWSSHLLFLPATEAGRTSRSTATAIGLLAVALLSRKRPRVADFSAGISLFLATVALLGYAYGVTDLYAMALFNNMALNTAAAIFMLSIATIFLGSAEGWSAIIAAHAEVGGATRRQLFFCLVPPVVGWLVIRALQAGWLGLGAAMALFVAVTIAPLALLILRDGQRMLALSNERRARDERLAIAAEDAQSQLADQALRLAREGAERSRIEEAMYKAQRLDAVGHLTGGMAHDFNNILMVLSGNLQLLKRRMPAEEPLRRHVDNMADAVTRGSRVTQQLLAFSRSQRLDIQPTPVEDVIARARQLIGNSLGPSVRIQLQLEAAGAWALCNADQLEHALLNLAVNARDAMPNGGSLTIACSLSDIAPQAPQAPDSGERCVLIRVTDTGTGMAADVAAHAAEPFFTTKDRGKGTGLGLAQVYGFVKQCKGDLRIVSSPGEGTTIELRFLPAAAAPIVPEAAVAVDAGPSVAARRLRVIVIDDDDGVREVIVQALVDAGYDVTGAADGESGLAQMDAFKPAAAVIDFIMPGMNGADVARAAQARHPGLPIIFVSGYSDTAALEGVSGASVLRKPFEVSTLTKLVERAVAD